MRCRNLLARGAAGLTDPAWTDLGFTKERQVMVKVFCGPCQKKTCALDHRCMMQVDPAMVFRPVAELMGADDRAQPEGVIQQP